MKKKAKTCYGCLRLQLCMSSAVPVGDKSLLATVCPHRYLLAGRTSLCSPVMLLQTLAKRVQPLIETSRIVPEHPVPHIGQ
jgi:hypothetical protein